MIQKSTRIFLFLLVIALIFSTFSSGSVSAEQQVFDEQVLIVSYKDRDQLADLAKRYDVVEVDSETQTVKIFSNQITRDALAAEGLTWIVDLPYTALINAEVKPLLGQTTGIPGYPCYRTVAEVYASADTLAADYPALVELIDIGDSWEKTQNANAGWDIEVLVLGNRNTPSVPKSDAFIMSGIHAREWAPPELNLRMAEYLLENYETDADVKWLLDYNRVHLVLFTNPDGRTQDEANQSVLWRKNTNNNYCGNTNSRGADLNRNFTYAWEPDSYQCGETYSGPSAASEPETQAIMNYVSNIFPDQKGPDPDDMVAELTATGMFIDLHSYSRLVLWPWGYTYDTAPNDASLRVMSYKFAYYNGHDPQKSTELYPSAGTTDDWAYGELGVPGFCFEVGDTFHQSCSVFDNDINPRNQQALLRAIKIARRPYRLTYGPEVTNLSLQSGQVEPGQNLTVNYTADDTLYSDYRTGVPSSNIDSIRYSIDKPSWISGSNPETIVVRQYQVPVYSGTLSISTTGLTNGQHTLFVESLDGSGSWGPPTAIFFTISNGDAPVAAADTYATDEDVELVVALAEGVLANDVDDGPMTAVLETDVTNGTLVLAADGSFTYMPDANFFSEDSFTYKAFDGELYSNTVSVTITVNPINDAPVTIADAYSTDQDIELVVEAPGVLTNDTDIDEDDLIAELETDADNGTLSLAADGSFTYMPDAGFFGEDNFTYKSYDGELYSEVVTVTITVNEVVPDVFNIYLPLMLK
jgi:VCBS repeat-containing protein